MYISPYIVTTANPDSVIKSDHSYFKVPDPSVDNGENEETSKRKKGRPRKYNIKSPIASSSKTQTKLKHFNNSKDAKKFDSPSTPKSKSTTSTPNSRTPTRNRPPKYTRRYMNCNKCENCLRPDCGKCRNCLDKPKFGGRNTKRQRCIQRICIQKVNMFYMPPGYVMHWFNQYCVYDVYTPW